MGSRIISSLPLPWHLLPLLTTFIIHPIHGSPVHPELNIPCHNGNNPYIANPYDCSKYYQCDPELGRFLEKDCPSLSVFNDKDNTCVSRLSPKDTCTLNNAVRECEKGGVALIPHPTTCQAYFNCTDDPWRSKFSGLNRYETECEYPDLFDVHQLKCVDFQNATCGSGRLEGKSECDYRANQCRSLQCPPCELFNPSCVGREDGKRSRKGQWSPFYTECFLERSIIGECGVDKWTGNRELFHPVKRQCVPIWEIPRRHGGFESSCEGKSPGRYRIPGLEIIAYHCPGNEMFLCQNSSCVPLPPVLMKHPLCEGKADGLWPNTHKLWSSYFIQCISKKSRNGEEQCDVDKWTGFRQIFNPESRQCLPLWEISKQHGGYKPSCQSKLPGKYSIPELKRIHYECPSQEIFMCPPGISFRYNSSLCHSLTTVYSVCHGKEDGLWPSPEYHWSQRYFECVSQKDKNGEQLCNHDERTAVVQIFHPEKRRCVPLFEIPRENGGRKPNCDFKGPGFHNISVLKDIFYRCPGADIFMCPHSNTSQCTSVPATQPHHSVCDGKEDGLWSSPEYQWSKRYFECSSQKDKYGEQFCIPDILTGVVQVFHPEKRRCVPVFEIPREHGGLQPTCATKLPGVYRVSGLESIYYRCPGGETFHCQTSPHDQTSKCLHP